MPIYTNSERLASVEEMILKVEGGAQQYQTGDGRIVQYPQLSTLYAERKRLEALIDKETQGASRRRVRCSG